MGFHKGIFGSSQARIVWRLQRVMLSMWVLLLFKSIVLTKIFSCPFWMLFEIYFVGMLIFHIWHWFAHQRFWFNIPMYEVHMYHHWILYPPKRFLSKVYKVSF